MKNHRILAKLTFLPIVMVVGYLASPAYAQTTDNPTDEQISAAIRVSNQKRGATSFWRSDNFGLIFGYDQRWKPANPSQKSTASVINWKSRASGGLMATCYLEVNTSSDVARLTPRQVTDKAKSIADAMVRNGRLRDPNIRLVSWRTMQQDNHPVVYLERDMRIENINTTYNARIYSIVTAWRGREINFECASEIPINMPKAAAIVEGPIKSVLGSLQFVRGG
jgi:hypothetical protein